MITKYDNLIPAFEQAASKKGYCFDRDDITGRYEDIYLQEAWEIFCLVHFGNPKDVS